MLPTTITISILVTAFAMAAILGVLGAKLRYDQAYGLIAGYNTASREEQQKYDIEGLAQHLGNGLMTMAVLIVLASLAVAMERVDWCLGIMGVFVFVAFIIVVGGRKFLPNAPKPGEHRVLQAMLSDNTFDSIKSGTKQWLIECRCGHKRDYWEVGGVRNGVGQGRELSACPACQKLTWQKVRKKTLEERQDVA